ncbi:MAG: bifunctional folylpolyglutamate synthase/dihydrofolate synthase [Acidobacteria bacterium]|nr:bifunctional folylpolyglutamate synthase/dihydrofolate synthase [Acidobacteriota bacterium]
MNFRESVKYLYGLGNEVLAMKLGLENIARLLDALGNPQNEYFKVQIAGTNGKGSTVAFLESICLAAGIPTGATTSPHLVSVTERVRIAGRDISAKDFARHATLVRETSEKLVAAGALETVPTFFEQATAIALSAFAEAGVALAILETGLGGRFDATTAARAEIVGITPVDYDHQRILGDSLAAIAAEKAAIIRPDTPVVVAPQESEAFAVIAGRCRELKVEPVPVGHEYEFEKTGEGLIAVGFATRSDHYGGVVPGLPGRHQIVNAKVAVNLAELLRDAGFEIKKQAILTGLETARHRGRLEYFRGMLFDGAHNAGGARALRAYLDEFVDRPLTLVFGSMRDKDLTEITAELFPRAETIVLTAAANPRSMPAAELINRLPEGLDRERVRVAETVAAALALARRLTPADGLICVTGSLYLVGEAQKLLAADDEI